VKLARFEMIWGQRVMFIKSQGYWEISRPSVKTILNILSHVPCETLAPVTLCKVTKNRADLNVGDEEITIRAGITKVFPAWGC